MKSPASRVALAVAAALAAFAPASAQGPVREALQPFVDRGALAGAVTVVVTPDAVADRETVGYANLEARSPMRNDTLFAIASMTKSFTATAVLMLADEGKLSLDDPIEKYLPEFKGQLYVAEKDADHELLKKPTHPVLVRNLLDHTSGMNNRSPEDGPPWDASPLRLRVRSYASLPLDFDPGTQWHYSNAGINTAGRIVEVVSGMPYAEFLRRRIFEPLGMKDTTFWPTEEQAARLATFYSIVKGKKGLRPGPLRAFYVPVTDQEHRFPAPSAGLFSTGDDLSRFVRMILGRGVFEGRRLLSEAAVAEMSKNQIGDLKANSGWHLGLSEKHGAAPHAEGYGLAMFVCKEDTGPVDAGSFGHDGAFKTLMWIEPKRNLGVVFLVQLGRIPPGYDEAVLSFIRTANARFGGAP